MFNNLSAGRGSFASEIVILFSHFDVEVTSVVAFLCEMSLSWGELACVFELVLIDCARRRLIIKQQTNGFIY